MKSKPIFNNAKVSRLLEEYLRDKKDIELRNRIVKLTMPLIGAAISKMHLFKNVGDIKQECALKVITAIPKYDKDRGGAFGFMWTVICNTCRTHAKRLGKSSLSLSTDEVIKHEAEVNTPEAFSTPENQYVLSRINEDLTKAMNARNGFRANKAVKGHTRAVRELKKAISSGDLFFDRNRVVRKLKRIGLSNKEVAYYCQYSMVVVRMQLLAAKENSLAINSQKIGASVPAILDS